MRGNIKILKFFVAQSVNKYLKSAFPKFMSLDLVHFIYK